MPRARPRAGGSARSPGSAAWRAFASSPRRRSDPRWLPEHRVVGRWLEVEPDLVEPWPQALVALGRLAARQEARSVSAWGRYDVLWVRQVRQLELRSRPEVECPRDVSCIRIALGQRCDSVAVADHLQDRLEAPLRVVDPPAPRVGGDDDRRDAEAHLPVVLVDVGIAA